MTRGSFDDFLNDLREFESGVSEARIEGSRDQVIQQVGQERFDAFEAGELTLTDLQYSSTNFLGFVGYQFGEPILIDLGYYEFDATPGINDFSGTFTGKNGVNNLDDLKTNVQEQIILDEFALNLERIETGLGNGGQSLDDFIGQEFTFTDVDGSEVQVELSLTGILAAAHLRGAFGTLNLLQNGSASADEIGTSILQFAEQFGGFEAPAVAALINGEVPPLETDSTLRPGGVVIDAPDDGEVDPPVEQPDEPGDQVEAPDEPDQPDEPDPGDGPAPVADGAGIPDAPAGTPSEASPALLRTFDPATGSFTVAGTDGNDGVAFGNTGDDIIVGFGGDDAIVGFNGNDFLDGGDGDDRVFGSQDDDIILGGAGDDILRGDNEAAGNGADIIVGGPGNDLLKGDGDDLVGADTFVLAPGDGDDVIQDFQTSVDVLDFTEFGTNPAVELSEADGNTVVAVGDVTVTLEGVAAGALSAANFIGANFDGNVVVVEQPDEPAPDPEPEEPAEQPDPQEPDDGGGNDNADNGDGLSLVGGRAVDNVQRRAVDGTDGDDVLNQSNFVDAVDIDGGAGDDVITGTSVGDVSDVLRGGDGNDTFFGLAGDDFIVPGAGDDLRVVGGAGSDTFFPQTDGGNDIFPEFSLQDRLDGTLLDGVEAINASRLANGRTLLEFEGANTTVQISGGVSPEQFAANANELLVNFPDGVQVQVDGAAVVEIVDNGNVVVEQEEEVVEQEDVIVENDNDGGDNDAGVDAGDFGVDAPAAPAAVQQTVANGQGGLTVTGTDGNDGVAFGNTGDDIIVGFGGDDAIVGFNGNDFLDGGDGDDRVFGSQDDDTVLGGAGDDILRGDNEAAGNGADIIVGGPGNDLLKGDGDNLVGADTFVLAPGDGDDVIQDFQTSVDVLDFSAFGTNPAVDVSEAGGNTVVAVGDVTVTLEGVAAGALGAANFIGANFDGTVVVVEQPDEPAPDPEPEGPADQPDEPDDQAQQPDPDLAPAPIAEDGLGIPVAPDGTPAEVSPVFLREFDPFTGSFTVTGTDGIDSSAYGQLGDDVIRTFGGDDSSVGFEGNDYQDLGAGRDRGWGLEGDDTLLGGDGDDVLNGDEGDALGSGILSGDDVLVGGRGNDILRGDTIDTNRGADRFVFDSGDGNDVVKDFQFDLDTLDFTEFGGNVSASLTEAGGNTVIGVGDVTVTLEGVDASQLNANNVLGVTFETAGDTNDQSDALASALSDDGFLA